MAARIWELLLLTWQIPQVFVGAIFYTILFLGGRVRHFVIIERAVFIRVQTNVRGGGMSLGPFIFLFSDPAASLIRHEYGHFIQSRILGPFYLVIIALPSFVRFWLIRSRIVKSRDYDSFYAEGWATRLGDRFPVGAATDVSEELKALDSR